MGCFSSEKIVFTVNSMADGAIQCQAFERHVPVPIPPNDNVEETGSETWHWPDTSCYVFGST